MCIRDSTMHVEYEVVSGCIITFKEPHCTVNGLLLYSYHSVKALQTIEHVLALEVAIN